MPGTARDISVGANGDVWITDAGSGALHKWNGSGWVYMNDSATRISVDSAGNPWFVKADGSIWTDNGTARTQIPGPPAKDIGAGGNVHIVGTNGREYTWTGGGWHENPYMTDASSIDVDAGAFAWIRKADGAIYRQILNSQWEHVPGALARDVAVGTNGDVWILGIGGGDPHRWNGATWDYMDGYDGINIDVAPDGQVWMVKEDGTIWRQ